MDMIGFSLCLNPEIVLSFKLIWVMSRSLGKPSLSTANPWFWAVGYIFLVFKSFTGWFAPLCPKGSLKVPAPKALAKIWCPRQIASVGIFETRVSNFSDWLFIREGSPCPGDIRMPS